MRRPQTSNLQLLTSFLLTLLLAAGVMARPLPPWQQAYAEGLVLEGAGSWREAAERFVRARTLQPRPRAGLRLPDGTTIDYDPYYHLAICLARQHASAAVVEHLVRRSAAAGVTPREHLAPLEEYVRRRAAEGGRLPGGEAPLITAETRPPSVAAAPTATPQPTATPRPRATPTPAPARLGVRGVPADGAVAVDGVGYPPGTAAVALAPGHHHVVVSAPSGTLLERDVELDAGEELTLELTPPPTPAATPTPAPAPWREGSGEAGLLAGGVGLLALVVIAAVVVLRRRARPRPPSIEDTPTQRLTPPGPAGALAGHTLGRYLIQEKLGHGGMATTYRARRQSDGKAIALKVPHEHCLDDASFRERFVREGNLGSQLHHPNIVRIVEATEQDGRPFIAMELVQGHTLRELLATTGDLPVARALDITRQVAEALDYAHSKGVVHRDLKPENLMVLADGRVLVMDFGIARVAGAPGLTATSVFVGTPAYAAPEAVEKGVADHRVDLYALGIILFEMLEGRPPYSGVTPLEQLRRHLEGQFPAREELSRPLPDAVWALLGRLVARDPGARFATAEALLVELRRVIRELEETTSGGASS